MPTYLYECPNCGRFEKFQSITAEPLKECPECGKPVRRIIGAPGIIFKGSGFYSTDSRKSSTGKENAAGEKKTAAADKAKEKVS